MYIIALITNIFRFTLQVVDLGLTSEEESVMWTAAQATELNLTEGSAAVGAEPGAPAAEAVTPAVRANARARGKEQRTKVEGAAGPW